MTAPLLSVENLTVEYPVGGRSLFAVSDVSLSVARGETLGLVGESGSGKSMTCMSILRLNPEPASRIVSGEILLHPSKGKTRELE